MKQGIRALGVAESYRGEGGDSYLAGVVVRADRVVEGFRFTTITVGGTDATGAVVELYDATDREDLHFVLISGVAPAWYNIVDIDAVYETTDVPVVTVTYEEGDEDGLRTALEDEFEGDALEKRLALYDSLPERRRLVVGGNELYVRSVGVTEETADKWVRGFTHDGRPEPARVARLAARGLLDFADA
jgi:hypothetical protein